VTSRGRWSVAATALFAAALILASATPSAAVNPPTPPGTIGSFPTYAVVPSVTPGQTFDGSASFASAAGFPATTFSTNSTTAKAPSGESAYLGSSTGFGQYFGSTRAQPYLYLSPAAGSAPSMTTISFAGPPPAGWGFAVGDIDADFVEIIAKDAAGNAIPGSALGAQNTDNVPVLNYCNNVPKPSSCAGPGPFVDVPGWLASGGTIGGTTYTTPIVKGGGVDTLGAYDWFLPPTTVRSLTLVFHVQSGFPIYQLWLAASAPLATINGTVVPSGGGAVPAGTVAELETSDGVPVPDIDNNPVVAPVAPDGTFSFATEAATYDISFQVPAGFDPIPTQQVIAGAGTTQLAAVTLAATPAVPPVPTLATTGVDAAPALIAALLALLAGLVLVSARRRRIR
jgi:hypothetical protein